MATEEERRERIHELLDELALEVDGEPSLLYGWALVAEWSATDGKRWLSYLASDAQAEPAPTWQAQGYLHNALHDWPSAYTESNDEDGE